MKKLLAVLALAVLAPGCPLKQKYDRTPNGWKVKWKDNGTISSGLHTKDQLYALFDGAMERSFVYLQQTWAIDPGYARKRLKENDALYTLVDDYRFDVVGGPSADDPSAKYASGETLNRLEVWIAFYNEHGGTSSDPTTIPTNAIPWTVRQNPANSFWYWGTEDDGNQYPALPYETHWQFTTVP